MDQLQVIALQLMAKMRAQIEDYMKFFIFLLLLASVSCTNSKHQSSNKNFLTKQSERKSHGKSRGYFQIQIKQKSFTEDVLELEAYIIPTQSFSSAKLIWKLPKGLKVLDGITEQTKDFPAGQTQLLNIKVDAKDIQDKDQFFLFVYKEMDGEKHGGTQSFVFQKSSDNEDESKIQRKVIKKKKIME